MDSIGLYALHRWKKDEAVVGSRCDLMFCQHQDVCNNSNHKKHLGGWTTLVVTMIGCHVVFCKRQGKIGMKEETQQEQLRRQHCRHMSSGTQNSGKCGQRRVNIGSPLSVACLILLLPSTCCAKPFWLFGSRSRSCQGDDRVETPKQSQALHLFHTQEHMSDAVCQHRIQQNDHDRQLPSKYTVSNVDFTAGTNNRKKSQDELTSHLHVSDVAATPLASSIFHQYSSGFDTCINDENNIGNGFGWHGDQSSSSPPLRKWEHLLMAQLSGGGNRGNRRLNEKSNNANETAEVEINADGTATGTEDEIISEFNETQLLNATQSDPSEPAKASKASSESLLLMLVSKSKLFESQQEILSKVISKLEHIVHALKVLARGDGVSRILSSLSSLSWQDMKEPLMNILPTILTILFLMNCWDKKTYSGVNPAAVTAAAVNESGETIAEGVVGGALVKGLQQRLSYPTLYGLSLLGASCGFYLFLYFITVGYALGITLPVVLSLLFYHSKVRVDVNFCTWQ